MQNFNCIKWLFKEKITRILISFSILESVSFANRSCRSSKTIRNLNFDKVYWVQIQGSSFNFGLIWKIFIELRKYYCRRTSERHHSLTIFGDRSDRTFCGLEQKVHWGIFDADLLQLRIEKRILKNQDWQGIKDKKTIFTVKLQKINVWILASSTS